MALRIGVTGAVTVITLDAPERRNGIDFAMCHELQERLAAADADRDVRALVIAGTERDFCTGADITAQPDRVGETSPLDYRYLTVDYQRLFQQLWELDTPVVSAVTGRWPGRAGCSPCSPTWSWLPKARGGRMCSPAGG